MARAAEYEDICYDTEFIDRGSTIDLVSIGIVGPDGREYYAVSREFSMRRLRRNEWLAENVLPHLPTLKYTFFGRWQIVRLDKRNPDVKSRRQIAEEVSEFMRHYFRPRLWAYFGAYDHVALAQLWGKILDLPEHIPMWTADIQQERKRLGNPPLPSQVEGQHHALHDARHNRTMLRALREKEAQGR